MKALAYYLTLWALEDGVTTPQMVLAGLDDETCFTDPWQLGQAMAVDWFVKVGSVRQPPAA